MRECERVDLPMTLAQLKRIKESLDGVVGSRGEKTITNDSIRQMFHELMNRLWDELDTHVFYQIESQKSLFYEEPERYIGQEVSKAFPTAARELTDASKCYATGRYTACVFHLMRALELGLSCMARVFGVSSDYTNWQNIIEQVEAKVRELPKTKSKNWKEDQEFYSQAASYFMVLKDAWRNYTAHMRGRYDEDEARQIMDNVCGFLKKLALRLSE